MAPRQRIHPGEEPQLSSSSSSSSSSSPTNGEPVTYLLSKKDDAKVNNNNVKKEKSATEADEARDRHDYFNLIALPIVMAAVFNKFGTNIFFAGTQEVWNGAKAPSSVVDDDFVIALLVTVGYFIADFIWVYRVPICVKSPQVIIKHHICAIIYMTGPLVWTEYSAFFGSVISVEVNTFLLILRRVLYKNKDCVPSSIQSFVDFSFYVSWIFIRMVVYPMILCVFFIIAYHRAIDKGSIFQLCYLFIMVHAFLVVLNLKWSYDLFTPMIKRMLSKEKTSEEASHSL